MDLDARRNLADAVGGVAQLLLVQGVVQVTHVLHLARDVDPLQGVHAAVHEDDVLGARGDVAVHDRGLDVADQLHDRGAAHAVAGPVAEGLAGLMGGDLRPVLHVGGAVGHDRGLALLEAARAGLAGVGGEGVAEGDDLLGAGARGRVDVRDARNGRNGGHGGQRREGGLGGGAGGAQAEAQNRDGGDGRGADLGGERLLHEWKPCRFLRAVSSRGPAVLTACSSSAQGCRCYRVARRS